jgi:integrase/recombinase XerC
MALPPSWAAAIEDYSTAQRVAGRAASTIKLRREQLSLLARHTDRGPWEVGLGDLVDWLGANDWSQERRRSVRTTLRSFYGWALASDLLPQNPADGLPVVKATAPNPRPTPDLVYRRAKLAGDARARLMIRLACECGLRRAEVAQVHSRDLERDLGGWSLVVHGKGNKARLIPLPLSIALELHALGPGHAFPGNDGGHLSARWVGRIIRDLLGEGYTMHGLRHRFATLAYQTNHDVFTLQAMLGHASPETTRRYVQVPTDAMRRMVEQVSEANGAA